MAPIITRYDIQAAIKAEIKRDGECITAYKPYEIMKAAIKIRHAWRKAKAEMIKRPNGHTRYSEAKSKKVVS
jgi:hypothetical protein